MTCVIPGPLLPEIVNRGALEEEVDDERKAEHDLCYDDDDAHDLKS